MIDHSDKCLLMIEPQNSAESRIDDELTALTERVFASAKASDIGYRGFHICVCGKRSDNRDWILPNGAITNSLMVHYVAEHRGEIPQNEIDKLRRLSAWLVADDVVE